MLGVGAMTDLGGASEGEVALALLEEADGQGAVHELELLDQRVDDLLGSRVMELGTRVVVGVRVSDNLLGLRVTGSGVRVVVGVRVSDDLSGLRVMGLRVRVDG